MKLTKQTITFAILLSATFALNSAQAQRGGGGHGGGGHGGGGRSSGGGSHSGGGASRGTFGGGSRSTPSRGSFGGSHSTPRANTGSNHGTYTPSRVGVSPPRARVEHTNFGSRRTTYVQTPRGGYAARVNTYRRSPVSIRYGNRVFLRNYEFYSPFYPFGDYYRFRYGFRNRIYFSFPWELDPWYPYYGYYFHRYPYYGAPCDWIVDNVFASYLSTRYNDEMQEPDDDESNTYLETKQVSLSDETKKQIQLQVQAELDARTASRTISFEDKLADANHVFVVSSPVEATPAEDQTCPLNAGDVVRFDGANDDGTMGIIVKTSKVGDCKAGTRVSVTTEQLVEFENEFNHQIDESITKMKSNTTVSSELGAPAAAAPVNATPAAVPAPTYAPIE